VIFFEKGFPGLKFLINPDRRFEKKPGKFVFTRSLLEMQQKQKYNTRKIKPMQASYASFAAVNNPKSPSTLFT
jgi:hypothetical protein